MAADRITNGVHTQVGLDASDLASNGLGESYRGPSKGSYLVNSIGALIALLFFSLISATPVQTILAQTAPLSPEARRDEISKVQEMLADPDPLMRLTNMEAIVKSGDSLKLQVALRTALTSDDRELRSLALRAYIASRKEIIFEVVLPPEVEAAYNASQSDPRARQAFNQRYPYYAYLIGAASRFQLGFPDYTFAQDRGIVSSAGRNGSFTITGDRLNTMLWLHNWGQCYIDFAPTRTQAFEGTLACERWPKLSITARAL
jgi:hypothetical protein